MSDRLAPTTTPDTKFFWDGARRSSKLLIQRCAGARALRHPPRPMCPRCNSLAWDTIESSGRGHVYSFVLPRHPPWPWFEGTYIVALVELEEGTRIVSNLCDVDPDDVDHRHAGRGVLRALRQRASSLPQFRPRSDAMTTTPRRSTGTRSGSATRSPPMTIDVTATVVVAGAIATRDFMPVHHDRDYANAQGAPEHLHEHHDRQRLLQPLPHRLGGAGRDGAEARDPPRRAGVRRLDARRTPARSPASRRSTARGLVEVEFRATNDQGDHLSGTAVDRPAARGGARVSRSLRNRAAIAGIGQTEFSKESGRSELQLACEAVEGGARRRRARAARRRRAGHLHHGLERGGRGGAQPRHPAADDVRARPVRRRRRLRRRDAGGDGGRDRRRRRRRVLPRVQRALRACASAAPRHGGDDAAAVPRHGTARTGCSRRRAGWRCTRAATCTSTASPTRTSAASRSSTASTRRRTPPRGSTSGRSRSRTTSARAGSSSRCCGCSTAARRATAASRSSSPRPSARATCASARR